jgi:hypothetical protein
MLGAQYVWGRQNAKEYVMRQFTDVSANCLSQTVTLYRYRTSGIGTPFTNDCFVYSSTLIASAVQSRDSCASPKVAGDTDVSNAPVVLDFATESSQSGWVGYRSRVTNDVNGSQSTVDGCYQIYWLQ